jgi:hypothetical protein
MWQMTSTFHLEEWLEYIGLLAAVSGFLLILSGHLAIAMQRFARGLAVNETAEVESLLWTAMKHRGELHLAVGGGVFALAKMVDLWTNPSGLF